MTALKYLHVCLAFILLTLGFAFPINGAEDVVVSNIGMRFESGKPQLHFFLTNLDHKDKKVLGAMEIKDRLTGKSVEVYSGELAEVKGGAEMHLSLDWENKWIGWGFPEVKLYVWEDGNIQKKVVASTTLFLAPSVVTTVGLVSLLAIGGRGGMLLISKLV